ncbi:MAG: hypothetical protein QXE22_04755 [Candidatus Bathyarchaeia archaeon]
MNGQDQFEAILAAVIVSIILAFVLAFGNLLYGFPLPQLPYRPEVEKFYWTFRGLDILAQAFLIFSASAAVAALFRREKNTRETEMKVE